MAPPSIAEVPAILLIGGLGTRLRPATGSTPKAIVPVAGKPFIHHLLGRLDSAGFRRAVLCTGFGAKQIRDAIGDKFGNIALTYSREDRPLGTGGAAVLSAPSWQSPLGIVINGDTLVELDYSKFLHWSVARDDLRACLALVPDPGGGRYGSVAFDADGRVTHFEEKGGHATGWINAGVYLIRRNVLETYPSGGPLSLESDVFPKLIDHGLFSYCQNSRFLDIGIPEDYEAAHQFVAIDRPDMD